MISMPMMTVRKASQIFPELIAAVERGETIVISKNGTPVAKIAPPMADRRSGSAWQSAFATLEKSLRSKRPRGYRVSITEADKYP